MKSEETKQMKILYEQGLSFKEIGERFHISKQAVHQRLRKHIESRPVGGRSKSLDENILRELYLTQVASYKIFEK